MSIVGSDAAVPPELGLVAAEPEDWIEALTSPGPRQDHAMERLHTLLLRAARHQVWRMRSSSSRQPVMRVSTRSPTRRRTRQ